MNPYVQKLGQYLKEHPFDGGERKIDNVLDYLAEFYLEDNPVSSKQIKSIQEEMGPYYENVPFAVSERLFSWYMIYAVPMKRLHSALGFCWGFICKIQLPQWCES